MEIELQGQQLQVRVNGDEVLTKELSELAKKPGAQPGLGRVSGRIGFQSHTGEVRFRNVQIKELGSTPSDAGVHKQSVGEGSPPQVPNIVSEGSAESTSTKGTAAKKRADSKPKAIGKPAPKSADGFHPLFNRQDLTGWERYGGTPNYWRVDAGDMVVTGDGTKAPGWLLTEREFSDFRLRFEYQLSPAANSGIAIRAKPGDETPDGATRRHMEVQLLDDASRLGIQSYSGSVRFRNVEILDLAVPAKSSSKRGGP